MSRLKELRKVVGDKLRESITDAEKLENAPMHISMVFPLLPR